MARGSATNTLTQQRMCMITGVLCLGGLAVIIKFDVFGKPMTAINKNMNGSYLMSQIQVFAQKFMT
jgi:hypothetical protein